MEAISLNVNGYLIKPIDFNQINNNLYKIVRTINIYRENKNYRTNLEKMVEQRTAQNSLLQKDKIQNYEKTLLSFVELVEKRDTYTGGHSQRVANYCKLIAEEMGYDKEYCELLYRAGILHDIGKIGTPDAVLLKPGKLDELEYGLMKEHVTASAELLRKIPMYKELSGIIWAHHEHYDGTGYPNGLKRDKIPELARIMIVADAFDAMTTNRIYKARMNIESAIKELKSCSGTQFDPKVVEVAIDVLKNITIDTNIFQLPSTEMEYKRFAYFYEDQITKAYNQNYLDLVLIQNQNSLKIQYITVLFIRNFTAYNTAFGWDNGDLFLKRVVNILHDCHDSASIFRVHGDDFVLISESKLEMDLCIFKPILSESDNMVTIEYKEFNTDDDNINSLFELENCLNIKSKRS